MATNLIDLMKKHIEAFTKGDWTTYRGMMLDNAVYEEEPTQQRYQSGDAWVASSKAWRAAFPDIKGVVREAFASGDSVVCEVEWSGTHKGPLTGPFGTIQATNRFVKVHAVAVWRFDGDRIRECHHYFDLMTLLGQLGVMPQAQPTAP